MQVYQNRNVAQTVKLQVLAEVATGQRRLAIRRLTNINRATAYRQQLIAQGILKVAR